MVALALGVVAFAAVALAEDALAEDALAADVLAADALVVDALGSDALGSDAFVETFLESDSTGLGVAAGLDVFDLDVVEGFEEVFFDPKNDLGSTALLLNKT